MIAVDTNLLVYAHRSDSEFHNPALTALTELAESGHNWAIPWPSVHEFISIVTHPRIYAPPSPTQLALDAIRTWIESPYCSTIGEGFDYFSHLQRLALHAKVTGPMIHDARIGAICIEHGVKLLWTADRDFSRFTSLKTHNPLIR